MMRVCHLNTCPVGIATQDPELRKKFAGKPEHLINLMFFIAEDLRRIMADLGFRTVAEMVGQVDRLGTAGAIDLWRSRGLDFSNILHRPKVPDVVGDACFVREQDHGLEAALDVELITACKPALESGEPVRLDVPVHNVNRTVGTMLSYHITRRYGEAGLAEDTIVVKAKGTAGQSFCAFGAPGLSIHLEGDANDYFGKGLSGAKLSIRPAASSRFAAEDNIIIGNVALYGATSGSAYIRGIAGERFCVRNSGAVAVVEGVGDHGCEYMTGGRAVILGPTGRNFAAGMGGGVAYVLDESGNFAATRCNREMVLLEPVIDPEDVDELRRLIEAHTGHTGSSVGQKILKDWKAFLPRFIKVIPEDYKRALEKLSGEEGDG
jgi:glutamate synthase domain-containing protein 3